jgi:hypothetical protein
MDLKLDSIRDAFFSLKQTFITDCWINMQVSIKTHLQSACSVGMWQLEGQQKRGKNGLSLYLDVWIYDRWSTRQRSLLRHCATSGKVASSIPDGVIGIFHWRTPSAYIVALVSNQPLTKLSTSRCLRQTNLQPSCTDCLEILGASTSRSHNGLSRTVIGQLYFYDR